MALCVLAVASQAEAQTNECAPFLFRFHSTAIIPALSHVSRGESSCADVLLQDSDADTTPDWTNIVDGRRSAVLIPLDQDIDGDGVTNILDAQPFFRSTHDRSTTGELPPHLFGSCTTPPASPRSITPTSWKRGLSKTS
jgi:hypothetical protein